MKLLCVSASLAVLCLPALVRADLLVQTYQPYRQDRFYTGGDKAFLGQAFDWSGVGQDPSGQWATMISPTYFLSAAHYHPNTGDTLVFYEDNTTAHPHSYTVASFGFVGTFPGGKTSDLWLGKLTAPIPGSDHITYYPILDLPAESDYLGLEILVNGKPNRVGRNNIDTLVDAEETPTKTTRAMEFDYNTLTGLGADEAYLISGDSGGPSFYNADGRLALVGVHYYHDTSPMVSGDTFVPYYIDQINAHMTGEQITSIIPEPASATLLLLSLPLLLRRRR